MHEMRMVDKCYLFVLENVIFKCCRIENKKKW